MNPTEATLPKRKRRWLTFLNAAIGLASLFVCWALIGVSFNFSGQSPLQQLEAARSKWDTSEIDNYKMSVSFGSFSYIGSFQMIVRDGQIVSIVESSPLRSDQTQNPLPDDSTSFASTTRFFSHTYVDYTIENLFNFATEKLASEPTMSLIAWCGQTENNDPWRFHYKATFNEQYGYLESLSYANCLDIDFGGGFMCGVVSDCYSGFHIRNFEPLP